MLNELFLIAHSLLKQNLDFGDPMAMQIVTARLYHKKGPQPHHLEGV